MAKIKKYEKLIIDLLNSIKGNSKDNQVIIDKENRHYQLVYLGNDSLDRYFFHVRIHLHLRTDGIICVYENRTEEELSDYLMEHGVLKSEILAAFLPQHVRQYAGYAVA
jgi:XisI protein